MKKEIIVDVALEGTRLAVLENNELVEFYIERPDTERLVGNIYRGSVNSVLPGMQAAFVDIGYEKNAFLYVGDALYEDEELNQKVKRYSIERLLKPGQEITVQVIKEPIGTKGPRVTAQITLPGRHLVLLPNADYIGISRRIDNAKERTRLKKFAQTIKPEGMGLIVRTASEGRTLEEFESDISFLMKQWKKIKRKERFGGIPKCIYKDLSLVYKTVRDTFTPEINRFIINDKKEYKNVLELVDMISPKLKNKVQMYNKEYDMFEYYNIDRKITQALNRKVWLKCGGYIVIDRTEALTVIDVNTGKYVGKENLENTVLKTNIQAAAEIAKQIRLRDIGGIIIIDFIDMTDVKNRKHVLNSLRQSLKKDRTKTIVVGMTGLGLTEMTRKKVRQGLNSFMTTECPHCEGAGQIAAPESIALKVEKQIGEFAKIKGSGNIIIEVHPTVAAILKGEKGKNLKLLQKTYRKKMSIIPNDELLRDEIIINGQGKTKAI